VPSAPTSLPIVSTDITRSAEVTEHFQQVEKPPAAPKQYQTGRSLGQQEVFLREPNPQVHLRGHKKVSSQRWAQATSARQLFVTCQSQAQAQKHQLTVSKQAQNQLIRKSDSNQKMATIRGVRPNDPQQAWQLKEFIETGETAKAAYNRNDLANAKELFTRAVTLSRRLPRTSEFNEIVTVFRNRIIEITHAQQSKATNAYATRSGTAASSNSKPKSQLRGTNSGKTATHIGDQLTRARVIAQDCKASGDSIKQVVADLIVQNVSTQWNEIVGLEITKRVLHETVVLPGLNPELFTGLRCPPKGILLFGPPGNGKTYLAKAAAANCGAVFFSVSASALTSKWHGESEKVLRTLFEVAHQASPSIIFLDEIDSVLSSRGEGEHEASRRLKTEFLVQFDGITASQGGSSAANRVIVLGATNRPFDLDDAVIRRFPLRLFIPLPSADARANLIGNLLRQHKTKMAEKELAALGKQFDGYSFSDLTNVCKEASMMPVRELPTKAVATLKPEKLRPITAADVSASAKAIRPSTTKECLLELLEWDHKYGASG
jgi:SpoVK/Ycf46/Vps4 family AAA+-type ATPase